MNSSSAGTGLEPAVIKLLIRPTAAQVAARWKAQYFVDGAWGGCMGGSAKKYYDRLLALGSSRSVQKIANVIGNRSWTNIECDACGAIVARAVQIGDEYRYLKFCGGCITAAQKLIERPSSSDQSVKP